MGRLDVSCARGRDISETHMPSPHAMPASFLMRQTSDPALSVQGAPRGFGREVLPHIFSVSGRVGTYSHTYPWYDEALRDSRHNAEIMRTECAIMECLESRQRATALLKWHVEPRNSKSKNAKALAEEMSSILEETWQFLELRRNLLEALWYGRYMTVHRFGVLKMDGKYRQIIRKWTPRQGDKVVFRYDDGTGEYDDDQVGIRMGGAFSWETDTTDYMGHQRSKVEITAQFGRVYFLDNYERQRVALHRHYIEDGAFYNVKDLGRICGVGIRDRIYWCWYAMQECLANALDFVERNAHGIEIWRFPANNPEAEQKTIDAAANRSNKAVLLVPVQPGELAELQTVEVIEPGFAGLDAIMGLIKDFFGAKIKRYILGQTLTSEAEATGLGSGVADAHLATFADIVQFDAIKLQETITADILRPLQEFNFPDSMDERLLFRLDTEADDVSNKLEAWNKAWSMGAKLPASDVVSMIGARMPDPHEEVLQNPQIAQAQQQMQAGGMQPPGGPQQPQGGGDPTRWQKGTTTTFPPMGAAGGDGASAEVDLSRPGQPAQYTMTAAEIDAAAAKAEEPTDGQREAGNYAKGHIWLHGLDITIETPKGKKRRPEWPEMAAHYGYLRGTTGKDGDHLDCFIGPHPESELVVIIDQETPGGRMDEHKAFLGFMSRGDAISAYVRSYTPGMRVGPVTGMTIQQFREWLDKGDLKARIAPQVSRYAMTTNPYKQDTQTLMETTDFEACGEPEKFDKLKGGPADGMDDSQFDAGELHRGMMHEMEHTQDPQVAKEIAKDHLLEDPNYYRKLRLVTKHEEGEQQPVEYDAQPRKPLPGMPTPQQAHEMVQYSAKRAPKPNGIDIAGKHYKPGQFIPGEVMDKATPEQKQQVEDGHTEKPAAQGPKIDPSSLSSEVLSRMSANLKKQGYNVRGGEDVRQLLSGRMLKDGQLWHEDWKKAWDAAQGAVGSRQATQQAKAEQKANYRNINWDRIRQLGVTGDPNEAGYITPTGSLVDLSGKREGGMPGHRSYDHREAGGTAGMQELMASGYVRWMPEAGGFDISKEPTPAQERMIARMVQSRRGEVVLDLEDGLGQWSESYGFYNNPQRRESHMYNVGTNPAKVLNDIRKFFSKPAFSLRATDFWTDPDDEGGTAVLDDPGSDLVDFTRFRQPNRAREYDDVVMVDLAKLDADLKKDKGAYIAPEGVSGAIGNRYNQFKTYLKTDKPIDMPEISFNHMGLPAFINGRHRSAVLRDLGQRVMPMSVAKEDADDFRAKYGVEDEPQFAVRGGDQTNSPAFKKWFGKSKVVDNTGKPLVVYHGTPSGGFSFFDSGKTGKNTSNDGWFGKGFYFTADKQAAQGYSGNRAGSEVIPAYLSLQNPLVINKTLDEPTRKALASLSGWGPYQQELLASRQMDGAATADFIEELFPGAGDIEEDDEYGDYTPGRGDSLREMLGRHDGVIVHDGADKFDEVVAFQPTQIKHATENKGTFSPKNKDIRFGTRARKPGKRTQGAMYVHRQYEDQLGPEVEQAKAKLPEGFSYNIVKKADDGSVTFTEAPDWDTADEPTVGRVATVKPDGTVKLADHPGKIYHHKWQFVGDDYQGFDVDQSKSRSKAWQSLNLPKDMLNRIGNRDYWNQHVTPRIQSPQFGVRGQKPSLWDADEQEHSSKDTSLPQVPAVMKIPGLFKPGTVNADIGGGKYDIATDFMRSNGVENLVLDPYNRSEEHNAEISKRLKRGKADTATVANVLNVIKEPHLRMKAIQQAAAAIKPGGTAYFQIYEGAGHGQGGITPRGWQNHRKTADYLAEIQQAFGSVIRKGNILIATQPVKSKVSKNTRSEQPVRYRSLAEEFAARYCELSAT